MKHAMTPSSQHGFSLLETVVVILLLAITSAAIIRLNSGLFTNASQIRDLQIDTQLLQACAEHVIATRRLTGFNETPDYDAGCEALPIVPPGSNTFDVDTTLDYTDSSCLTGAICQRVEIRVNETWGATGPLTLQLVKY